MVVWKIGWIFVNSIWQFTKSSSIATRVSIRQESDTYWVLSLHPIFALLSLAVTHYLWILLLALKWLLLMLFGTCFQATRATTSTASSTSGHLRVIKFMVGPRGLSQLLPVRTQHQTTGWRTSRGNQRSSLPLGHWSWCSARKWCRVKQYSFISRHSFVQHLKLKTLKVLRCPLFRGGCRTCHPLRSQQFEFEWPAHFDLTFRSSGDVFHPVIADFQCPWRRGQMSKQHFSTASRSAPNRKMNFSHFDIWTLWGMDFVADHKAFTPA